MTIAIQVQGLGVSWQVYDLTKDPLSLGLVGLFEVIPAFGLAMFAGHWADSHSRKKMVLAGLALQGVASVALLLLTTRTGEWSSTLLVWSMYGAVFTTGMARALLAPAIFGLFGDIVPKRSIVRASAWNTTVWKIAASLGPAFGGLVYGYSHALIVYSLSLSALMGSILLIAYVKPKELHRGPHSIEPFKQSMMQGLHFVFNRPVILGALALDLFAVLFGGAVALFPFFADKLGVGPEGLGWMRASPFIGAFFMAMWLAHYPPRRHSGKILLASVSGFGLCMIIFSLSESFAFTLIILGISGAFDSVSVMMRSSILQLLTPDSMKGRVASVNSVFIHSSNELGALESGLTAKWFGTVPSVMLGGCLTLAVVAIVAIVTPKLRRLHLADLENST